MIISSPPQLDLERTGFKSTPWFRSPSTPQRQVALTITSPLRASWRLRHWPCSPQLSRPPHLLHVDCHLQEYYRNGAGYSEQEFQQFYQLVDDAFPQLSSAAGSALVQRALSTGRTAYGRPNFGQDYFYLRAQQKDALGIVYFQPAITAIMNWQDRSFQVTPELSYTGVNNLELRARLYLLQGSTGTEFGGKQASRRLEVYVRYYF